MQVRLEQGDICSSRVDAIVNPSNSRGLMEDGVSEHIVDQAGEAIQKEVMSKAPIAIGAALVTQAGGLSAKYIIHVPTMEEPGMKIGVENVRRAIRAALVAAEVSKFDSIGVPGVGTHVGGVPLEESARAIVEEIRAHKKDYPAVMHLIDASPDMIVAFEEALRNAQIRF